MATNRRITKPHTQQDIDRFWSRVDVRGPNECWPWIGSSKHQDGYGQFYFEGKNRGAHRIVFFLHTGYWPNVARHSCDNPPCCNFSHILDGTIADNNADMRNRGRARYVPKLGKLNPWTKFSDTTIQSVKDATGSQASIAAQFGMSQSHVCYIKTAQRRAHGTPVLKRIYRPRLSNTIVDAIRNSTGTATAIAYWFGISISHVSLIKRGKRHS